MTQGKLKFRDPQALQTIIRDALKEEMDKCLSFGTFLDSASEMLAGSNMAKAYSLWKQWWQSTECEYMPKGHPTYCTDDGDVICFFCGSTLNIVGTPKPGWGDHDTNCIYPILKQMAEEECCHRSAITRALHHHSICDMERNTSMVKQPTVKLDDNVTYTLVPGAPHMSQPVVVLGQHRSGTSILARILQTLGVHMGTFLRFPDKGNPEGYWEDLVWRGINKTIINAANGTWYRPPSQQDITDIVNHPDIWFLVDATCRLRAKHKIWGFKDPRTVLTIHALHKYLPSNTKYVIIKRDQEATIDSLKRRAGRKGYSESDDHWLELTSRYDQDLSDFLIDKGQVWQLDYAYQFTYEDLVTRPRSIIFPLTAFLDLPTDKVQKAVSLVRRDKTTLDKILLKCIEKEQLK